MQVIVALILIMLYALGWLLVIVVGGIASLVEHIMKKRAADKARESRKAKVAGALRENTGQTGHSDREPSRETDQATPAPKPQGHSESHAHQAIPATPMAKGEVTDRIDPSPESPGKRMENPAKGKHGITESATGVKVKEDTPSELSLFNNLIYHIKLLGHEDTRFQLVSIKAYELITQFAESKDFFRDIMDNTSDETDFATEVIRFIVVQKSQGISDADIIRKIRTKYITRKDNNSEGQSIAFSAKPNIDSDPTYVESDTSLGSRQLTAKSKIAHKHKAIQYANVIGNKLVEEFSRSGEASFHEFIRKQCKPFAAKGDSAITTEDFEPHRQYILTYKKSNKKSKTRTVATSVITPKKNNPDSRIDAMLNILNRLTSSRLPRYEAPGNPSLDSIVQREYKKTSPFEIYNDLVLSEYSKGALSDKRFSVLYQLILFISDCLESGMSEDETINALSSLRVVKKRDLTILRERESRFKGLSSEERDLVLNSEICSNSEMTSLYIKLIKQFKKHPQSVSLDEYVFTVLMKNYKESVAAWRLLKYIYLKGQNKSNREIAYSRYTILECYHIDGESHSTRGSTETYFKLERSFKQLKNEYDRYVDMTRYNFERDGVSTDMLNIETLRKYLPKRFDAKGRLCSHVLMTPIEADLFSGCETRIISDRVYVMVPIPSLSTKDLYSLMLTVVKQKRKIEKR